MLTIKMYTYINLFIILWIKQSNAMPRPTPIDLSKSMVGTSYCSHSPNFQCFGIGWPICCNNKDTECPDQKPSCDMLKSKPSSKKIDTLKTKFKPSFKPLFDPKSKSIIKYNINNT